MQSLARLICMIPVLFCLALGSTNAFGQTTNLIVNGSFETPAFPQNGGCSSQGSSFLWGGSCGVFPGWTGIFQINNGTNLFHIQQPYPDGQQILLLQSLGPQSPYCCATSYASQSLTLPADGHYILKWQDALRTNSSGQQTYSVVLDSTTLGTYSPVAPWTPRSVAMEASAGVHQLTFQASPASYDNTAGIDVVTLSFIPTPTLVNLTPPTAPAGTPGLSLTVNGTNFVSDSVVQWNEASLVTTYISASVLTAWVPAKFVASQGNAGVRVLNPGGSVSETLTFGITATCVTSISPQGAGFPATGGSGTILISAPAGCSWGVSNNPAWVSFSGPASGSSNGSVNYQVAPNPGAALSATLIVGGLPFTVEEASGLLSGLSLLGSMTHLASGGGWETTITLVNMGSTSNEALLNFLGDDGLALPLPFLFPQTTTGRTSLVASALDQTLDANAMLLLHSQQPNNPLSQTGSAQVLTSGSINGFAIFRVTSSGQEAVVPLETRNASSYFLAFDNTAGISTGVALANRASTAASVPIVIRDDAGASLGSGTIPLAANGHASFVLANSYAATAGKRGTVKFDTPAGGQISVLGLRTAPTGAGSTFAVTTIPLLANAVAGKGSMAQLASGGGWQTTITLVNTGPNSAQAQLSFFDDSGAALYLPLTFPQTGTTVTASALSRTLAAGATLVILTDDLSAASVGSVQVVTTGAIGGFATFRVVSTGQEAVVPLETRNANSYVLAFDNTNGLATGLALVNSSAQAVSVPVVLRDDTGATIGNDSIVMQANGHTSFMLTAKYSSAAGRRGTVEFATPVGAQIGVLGLRASPTGIAGSSAVTTLPVFVK